MVVVLRCVAIISLVLFGSILLPSVSNAQTATSTPTGTIATAIPSDDLGGGLYSGSSSQQYDFLAASGAGKFLVISNGQVIWSKSAVYPTMIAGTDTGIVYIGSSNNGSAPGTIEAWNFLTDQLLWTYTGGFNSHHIKIDNDGNLVFVMTDFQSYMTAGKTRIIKLNGTTGQEIWSVYPFGNSPSDPSFGSDSPVEVVSDGYIIAPKYTPYLIKYDALGNTVWSLNWGTEAAIGDTQRIISDGAFIYLISIDRGDQAKFLLHKLNAITGELIKSQLFSSADLGFPSTFASGVWGFDAAFYNNTLLVSGVLYVSDASQAQFGPNQIFLTDLTFDFGVNWAKDYGGDGTDIVGARGTNLNVSADGVITVFGSGQGTSNLFGSALQSPNNFLIVKLKDQAGDFIGTSAQDLLYSTPGNDIVSGLGGSDTLFGGDGIDTLNGDTSSVAAVAFAPRLATAALTSSDDSLVGGKGNDTINGGPGTDTALYSGNRADYTVSYNSATQVFTVSDKVTNRDGTDTISTVENFQFADGTKTAASLLVNVVTGTNNADTLTVLSGSNELYGLAGNDTLKGGTGNDLLDGGTGADKMTGGAGDDVYIVDNASDTVTEALNGGNDTVKTTLSSYTLPANVENLIYIGSGNFSGTGNTLSNSIYGGNGSDVLDGGTGNDVKYGGAGNDIYFFNSTADLANEDAGAGTDTVISTVTITTLGASIENLSLGGSANLNGTGNSLDNVIQGNTGNNVLSGGDGADTFIGNAGNDTFYGESSASAGNDTETISFDTATRAITFSLNVTSAAQVTGGAGTDRIYAISSIENLVGGSAADTLTGSAVGNRIVGNAGKDTLAGLTGPDVLVGNAGLDKIDCGADTDADEVVYFLVTESPVGSNRDQVTNFKTANDKMDLSAIDANTAVTGNQAFTFNVSTAKANSVWYAVSGSDIIVRGDVNGNTTADFEVLVKGITSITASSFVL